MKWYPHDTTAFTEGLEFHDGVLYEGTGEPGSSQLRKEDLKTGKVLKSVSLDRQYFGEGITFFGGKIYELTWESHVAFQYDTSFKLLKQFYLDAKGWGMTHDQHSLILSDGSSTIYFRNPGTLNTVKTISVTENGNLLNNINELEYINGYIYSNIWQTDDVIKIDPGNGKVVGRANLSGLLEESGLNNGGDPNNVLNGIAYDSTTQKVYVTGKRWPAIFEIKFD